MMAVGYEMIRDVAVITLNRPDVYNTINAQLSEELIDAIRRAAAETRVMLLTGAGKAFSAGADLRALMDEARTGTVDLGSVTRDRFNPVIQSLDDSPIPTVAAINGPAAGAGMGLALACDLRIMSSDAYLMSAFINVGLAPDSGTTWLLPRMVGISRATEITFSGRKVGAAEAAELGLAHQIVDSEKLLDVAMEWTQRLADGPTEAYAHTRALLRSGGNLSDALIREDQAQAHLGMQPAFVEGALAFLQKRKPDFRSSSRG